MNTQSSQNVSNRPFRFLFFSFLYLNWKLIRLPSLRSNYMKKIKSMTLEIDSKMICGFHVTRMADRMSQSLAFSLHDAQFTALEPSFCY